VNDEKSLAGTNPNPRGDNFLVNAINAAFAPLSAGWLDRKRKHEPITEAELLRVKVAFADAEIALDRVDLDDKKAWDAAYEVRRLAERELLAAAKRPIADVPLVSLGQGDYTRNLMAEDVIDPRSAPPPAKRSQIEAYLNRTTRPGKDAMGYDNSIEGRNQ